MNPPQDHHPLYRWSFTLIAEPPGPSQGDALEFIEDLGFRTSAFAQVSFTAELTCGRSVIARFEVLGSREMIESLRTVHDHLTGSSTPRPVPLSSCSLRHLASPALTEAPGDPACSLAAEDSTFH